MASKAKIITLQAKKKLGEFLKSCRVQAGLSLEESSKHLELISVKMLEDIEAGRIELSMLQIYACANIYNISPEDMLNLLVELKEVLPGLDLQATTLFHKKA